MNEGWKVLGLFSAVFAAAFSAEQMLVPDVVPVGLAGLPQPLWAVATAFTLRALELISGSVALIAVLLMFGVLADRLRRFQIRPETVRSPGSRHRPSRSIP